MAFVDELSDWVLRAAQRAGIDEEKAFELAEEVQAQARRDGGRKAYLHAEDKKTRDAEIRRRNNGRNRDALCAEYRISRRTFYRVAGERG